METQRSAKPFGLINLPAALLTAAVCLLATFGASAAPLTINIVGVGPDGGTVAAPTGYRWTVEEDATKASIPGKPADTSNYSFSFHTSYMPVIAAGRVGTARAEVDTALLADPDVARIYNQTTLPDLAQGKRYYVSIAAEGFQMGGAPVEFSSDGTSATATVYLNQYPVPTAQISVFAFEDNSPLNGAPDLPQELGLAGFHVHLIEAGGTYGMSGGEVTQDGFGNPLGTTYNPDGSVLQAGSGIILTDVNGVALIKNLYPAKYTILIDPPTGSDWHQTSTIEGTKGIDAWVRNGEPSFFQEFGPPGHHVFVGFTRTGRIALNPDGSPVLPTAGGHTVTGRIVNNHNSRPPVYTFYKAAPVTECWVGLNESGAGRTLYTAPCNKDSTFSIPNVPDGSYDLVVWDDPLDMIIGTTTITVGGADLALNDVPVTSWFGRYQGRVFQDIDGTGLPFFLSDFNRPHIEVDKFGNETEVTTPYAAGQLKPSFGDGIASNIRFRDGSIYQSVVTKPDGTFAFTEVFPFFNFMVAEIDYARWKATGATIVVDDGGVVDPAANLAKLWGKDGLGSTQPYTGLFGSNDPQLAYDPWTRLNPQLQQTCLQGDVDANTNPDGSFIDPTACTTVGDKYYRSEQGVTLLEAMQTFLGQTNHIEWGKQPYAGQLNGLKTQNGGIAGIVHYAITRAEDDPRYAAAEPWEPGIPRVQVNMYLDCDGDTYIDKPKNDGSALCAADGLSSQGYVADLPDVDNYPFDWRTSGIKGPEDVCRSAACKAAADPTAPPFSYGDVYRWGGPGVDDPTQQAHVGLGVTDSWDDSVPTNCPDVTPYYVPGTTTKLDCFDGLRNFNQIRPAVFDGGYAFGRVAGQAELPMYIGATGEGTYIIEAVAPPGYLHQGNGDQNVAFGDTLKASSAALPFECVGMTLPVPANLTLFPGESNPNFDAGQVNWRKCDMKAVPLVPGTNPAPDFYMFTEAPVAGHGVGFILDDTAAEFNHFAPTFGEKYSPPHLPVSIQDWTGREISRVYSDEFGSYNFLVPSSFTINPPYPSGVMPSMMVACMNHPGPITKDPVTGVAYAQPQIDPFFNRGYTQFCYTLQYLAGKTTYLDTPVLPIAAFASVGTNPLDCECAEGTPVIYSANHGIDDGPWVPTGGGQLLIVSMGTIEVTNPAYDPTATTPPRNLKTIPRHYGFGAVKGSVTLNGNPLPDGNVTWNGDGGITVTVPSTVVDGQYQLMITRGDNGKQSVVGLTLHVGGSAPVKVNPGGANGAFKTIQAAIDAAPMDAATLITVAPGTYNEYVIMDRRVRLQGWGAGSTFINAAKSSTGGLAAWRALINAKAGVTFDLLPGQALGVVNPANNEPALFGAEEGPGILVVGKLNNAGSNCQSASLPLRIDGLTITGADAGGGVLASGYDCNLQVSNNRVVSNYGTYGGGIRIGHTALVTADNTITDAFNPNVNIHHNWISQNGASEVGGANAAGGGGGITLGTGANRYTVADNNICGNFSMADGGGISHLGLMGGGSNSTSQIIRNKIVFNQTFNQSADPVGGGLSIAGAVPVGGGGSTGTGDVLVDANLIQGNQAGAGDGGGVSIARTVSGIDANATDDIVVTNNMIVNNVAAHSGGGVALTDNAGNVRLVNNTVASNVSTATNRHSNTDWANPSTPQVAGISVLGGANPTLLNNNVWANRSYIYLISGTTTGLFNPTTTDVNAPVATPMYWDLGTTTGNPLVPRYSVLTQTGENGQYVNGLETWGNGPNRCNSTGPTYNGPSATPADREGIRCNLLVAADSTTLFVKPNNFLSVIDPTQPVQLADATVMLRSALTFDETGNFINVIFSPLTQWTIDADGNVGTELRADYHIGASSIARDHGRNRGGGATGTVLGTGFVPLTDFDGQVRPDPTSGRVDIGADEILP